MPSVSVDLTTFALLFGAGLLAGTLNAISGGGSLLTLPLLIFLGLPPTLANGTNRVAILVQNLGASWTFARRDLIPRGWLALAVPPALVGVLFGTWAAVRIGDVAFQRALALALVLVAAWTMWRPLRPPEGADVAPPEGRSRHGVRLAFLLVGAYGGFIQAGVGFVVLAVTAAGGLDLVRGNALKALLVLAFTTVALAIFAQQGMVAWTVGLALAAGQLLGALLGVHLQVLKGHAWVRGVVTATIVVFALRLLVTA